MFFGPGSNIFNPSTTSSLLPPWPKPERIVARAAFNAILCDVPVEYRDIEQQFLGRGRRDDAIADQLTQAELLILSLRRLRRCSAMIEDADHAPLMVTGHLCRERIAENG